MVRKHTTSVAKKSSLVKKSSKKPSTLSKNSSKRLPSPKIVNGASSSSFRSSSFSSSRRSTSSSRSSSKDVSPEDMVLPKGDLLNNKEGRNLKRNLALFILLVLVGFVLYALFPFLNTFLGAFIVYFLFRPFNRWLRSKNLSKGASAGLTLLLVLLLITLPLYYGAKLLIGEIASLSLNSGSITQLASSHAMDSLNVFIQKFSPSFNLFDFLKDQILVLGSYIKDVVFSSIGNIARLIIDWVLFFFLLFYLFFDSESISERSKFFLPFSDKNRQIIFHEFKKITNSTVIATGGIGFLQGLFMALGFYVFGVPSPVLWGFVSMIFAMLPVVGISFIWVPSVLYLIFIPQTYGLAIGLAIWGFFVTNIDYVFLRPFIQKKLGKLHPLITLIGIFMGLPIFGILGLILGPLLLSLVILLSKMYLEEYF